MPQNSPRAISVLTLGNKVILYCMSGNVLIRPGFWCAVFVVTLLLKVDEWFFFH